MSLAYMPLERWHPKLFGLLKLRDVLQADAAARLGWENLTVIDGGGGEFERHPAKEIAGFGLRNRSHWESTLPPSSNETRRLAELDSTRSDIASFPKQPSVFQTAITTGTSALALDTLGVPNSQMAAETLWTWRLIAQAA